MSEPLLCVSLSKTEKDTGKPLTIEFSFQTDIGRFRFSGQGSVAEIVELLPIQIQNAGATYRLMRAFMDEAEG
jgi:hypothetical protein